jgi:GT2 family glycosyltransferase
MTFAIMIPTRNRPRELEVTLAALSKLRPAPHEVFVCADGCEIDDQGAWARLFPRFTCLRNESPRGSVYSRNRMLQAATSDIVVSLDDDSHPVCADFLQQVANVFQAHSEAAVVVFPEVRPAGPFPHPKTRFDCGHYVAAYANCAAAMRRDVYLTLRGFATFFEHMYEEPDYALQCYAAGYGVWFEPSIEIAHRQSEINRDPIRRHQLNARNELWSVWLRCPWPWLPLVSFYRVARQFLHACAQGLNWAAQEPSWWLTALKGVELCHKHRQPVRWSTYSRWMRLARRPIHTTEQFGASFPPPVHQRATGRDGAEMQVLTPKS